MQIIVPIEHDSFSELTINGERFLVRFSYNDTFDYWTFGIYERNRTPIIAGLRVVPHFPLHLFSLNRRFENTSFIASSNQENIGLRDFWNENAQFWMVTK
jgi:hypothetical protein